MVSNDKVTWMCLDVDNEHASLMVYGSNCLQTLLSSLAVASYVKVDRLYRINEDSMVTGELVYPFPLRYADLPEEFWTSLARICDYTFFQN